MMLAQNLVISATSRHRVRRMTPWQVNLGPRKPLRNRAPDEAGGGQALSLVAQLGDLAPNETGPQSALEVSACGCCRQGTACRALARSQGGGEAGRSAR